MFPITLWVHETKCQVIPRICHLSESDIYRPQTKLREGNVFKGVCLSGGITGRSFWGRVSGGYPGGRVGYRGGGIPYPRSGGYFSSRYASYWNAFSFCFQITLLLVSFSQCCHSFVCNIPSSGAGGGCMSFFSLSLILHSTKWDTQDYYISIPYGVFRLPDIKTDIETETERDTDKFTPNPMKICMDVCLSTVWTPPHNSIQSILSVSVLARYRAVQMHHWSLLSCNFFAFASLSRLLCQWWRKRSTDPNANVMCEQIFLLSLTK